MADSEDVNTLKRRGRRRLVGAIALVLAAVIVLPMVFDSDPRSTAPVSVRIPGEDESAFTPKVMPKAPEKAPEKAPAKAAEKAPEKAVEKAPEKAPEKVAEKAPEKAVEKAPEPVVEKPAPKIEIKVTKSPEKPAAVPAGEQFIVPAGAYVDPVGVVEKLKAAKIPYYTEPIATKDGTVTRVRAGPFASREAADRVLKQLKDLGLKPGNVASKS
jgi:DedD protein